MKFTYLSGVAAIALTAAALLWASALSASATVIGVGGSTTTPDLFGDLSSDTVVATALNQTVGATNAQGQNNFTAVANVEVVKDPNNTLCGVANSCLDFVYQVKNTAGANGSDSIITLSMGDFTGFTTDVGTATFAPNGLTSTGGQVPDAVQRPNADTVNFDYTTNPLLTGSTTQILVIATNATLEGPGSLQAIDGGTANLNAFSPVPVPLIGHGLLALLAVGGVLGGGKFLEGLKKRHLQAA